MKKDIWFMALIIVAGTLTACVAPTKTNTAIETTMPKVEDLTQKSIQGESSLAEETVTSTENNRVLTDKEYREILEPLLIGLNDIDFIGASTISVDERTSIAGKNEGEVYFKVIDSRFKSLSDIDAFLNTYLTADMRASRYLGIMDTGDCTYIERDGILYVRDGGRGCGFPWADKPAEISDQTTNSFTACKAYDEFGAPALIKLGIVYTEEGWKINTFEYMNEE